MIESDNILVLKAFKRDRRNEEIALHGKPITRSVVFKNHKTYTRKSKHKGLMW